MRRVSKKIGDWLENRLINQEHGIILDDADLSSFDLIQDFIEANDHCFKTTVIYYNAFATESAAEFSHTLQEELTSKLGSHKLKLNLTLAEAIANAGLKMIIIDQSYLHPWETTGEILRFLTEQQVALILVGAEVQMNSSLIMSHPATSSWHRLVVNTVNNLEITNNIVIVEQCNYLSITC
ncbi:MAG: hypothetical protein RLZZ04_3635 [Cyanobacteriota bacterium]|jgi:hypothetical protein